MTPDSLSRQSLCRLSRDLGRVAVERNDRAVEHGLDAVDECVLTDDYGDFSLFDDIAHAVVRVRRVDRHIGRARFQAGEDCDDWPFGAVETKTDQAAPARSCGPQLACEPVRRRFDLRIGQYKSVADDRGGIAANAGLRLEYLMQAAHGPNHTARL